MRRVLAGIVVVLGVAVVAVAAGACQSSDVSRELGARCTTSEDCDDRCLPASASHPDGFCTVVCNAADECPGDAACVEDDGGSCLFHCADDDSCRFLGETWRCRERVVRGQPASKVKVCRGQ
jgi:hypothetical protein